MVANATRWDQILTGRRGTLAGGAVILVLLLVAYWPCLNGTWLVDDSNYIVDNELLRDATGLKTIWTDLKASKQYYPLVFTSLWVDYQVWGLDPLGYHLVNLVLHLVNSLLIWWLLRYLGFGGAWVAAAVFAVHPVHVESVAWITERKNVLSTFFYLLALFSYLKFVFGNSHKPGDHPAEPQGAGSYKYYLLALATFALALLSKTSTATLPGAVLLLIWWKQGRIRLSQVWYLFPVVAMGLVMGLVTVWLERTNVGATGGIFDISFAQKIQVAGLAVWHYVVTVFWPFGLTFDYGRWNSDPADWTMWLGPIGVAAVLAGLWRIHRQTGRGPLTAVLFFLGTVFPALGFFNLFFFRYSYVADHFLYPASLGLICLGVGVVSYGVRIEARFQRASVSLAMVVLLGLSILSWNHAGNFVSMTALCRSILERNPKSWLGHNNLGDELMKEGRLTESREHLHLAEAIAPSRLETQLNLTIVCMNLEDFSAAAGYARRAIELGPEVKFGYNLLGEVHMRAGDPERAIPEFDRALAIDSTFTKARANLGSAFARLGRYEEAVDQLEQVVSEDQGLVAARSNLGIALVNLGEFDRAVDHFEAALKISPGNTALQQNLEQAKVLAARADGK